jgi:hypothetical protein
MRELERLLRMKRAELIQNEDNVTSNESSMLGHGTTERLVRISQFIQAGWVAVTAWRWLIYAGVLD